MKKVDLRAGSVNVRSIPGESRCQRVFAELKTWNLDILFLQECFFYQVQVTISNGSRHGVACASSQLAKKTRIRAIAVCKHLRVCAHARTIGWQSNFRSPYALRGNKVWRYI